MLRTLFVTVTTTPGRTLTILPFYDPHFYDPPFFRILPCFRPSLYYDPPFYDCRRARPAAALCRHYGILYTLRAGTGGLTLHLLSTAALVGATAGIGLVVTSLGIMLAIAGAIVATTVQYIMPGDAPA